MDKIRRVHLFEILLYTIVLVAALSVPFLSGGYADKGWRVVMFDWVRILPFILVFLINNYILVPRLLFKEKYLYYFLGCFALVIAVVYLSDFLLDMTRYIRPPFESMHGSPLFDDLPPPGDKPPFGDLPPRGNRPPHNGGLLPGKHIHHIFNFGLAIVSFLLIGFNTGIKSFVRWSEERVRQAEKDRQHVYTELAFLKHQISPHFFMNTLNNIHALVDIDTEQAKDAIIKLSRLMRYLLYEADVQKVSLKKEIEFIGSYIELMRLRYDEKSLEVETIYPANTETIAVPSFLFLSFIENAFKHGINLHNRSSIRIQFAINNGWLTFTVSNSKSGVAAGMDEASGLGLENVRKRLNLIFKDNYSLDIRSTNDMYEVILKIPVSNF